MSEVATPGTSRDGDFQAAVVDLSRDIVYNFMNGNGEANLLSFADGITFIGPQAADSPRGLDDYIDFSRRIRDEKTRIVLTNQAIEAIPVGPDHCLVLIQFRLFLSKGLGNVQLRGVQCRWLFHWDLDGDEPKLLAIESSFDGTLRDGVLVPPQDTDARETTSLGAVLDERLIELRDDHRVSHFVEVEDILYVEARGHKSVVHCKDEVFQMNEGISVVEERLGPTFVRLHRSFLVNPWHLRTLSDKGATLDDGEVLPVPARRLESLREQLGVARRQKGDVLGLDDYLFRS